MRLESITLVLENCDWITIDGKYIKRFFVEDVKMSIRRTAINSIDKIEKVHHFAMEIDKNANIDRYAFEQEHDDFKEKLFDRLLEYDDITQIEFNLVGNLDENYREHHHYYLAWESDDENNNAAQKSRLDEHGNLYILVDKDMEIEDCFPYAISRICGNKTIDISE